jgi:DNA-binding transcriptional LysR family regulator
MARPEQHLYRSRVDDLRALRTFVAVVEENSFSGAARRLSVVPSTITKHVQSLEERFEGHLIARSTKRLAITDLGERVYKQSVSILADVAEMEQELRENNSTSQGVLKITVPTGFAAHHLAPIISSFVEKYPRIMLDVRATNDTLDLIADGFDAAIRLSTQLDLGLIAIKLTPNPAVYCAAPFYLEHYGTPRSTEELLEHNCLVTRGFYGGRWPILSADGKIQHLAVRGNLMTNDGDILRAALLAGFGIGYIARFQVYNDLNSGRLIELFPGQDASTSQMYAVYPAQRKTPLKTRVFIDHLRGAFRARPPWT